MSISSFVWPGNDFEIGVYLMNTLYNIYPSTKPKLSGEIGTAIHHVATHVAQAARLGHVSATAHPLPTVGARVSVVT